MTAENQMIQEAMDSMNRMFVGIEPRLKGKTPVTVRALNPGEGGPYPVDVRVIFDECLEFKGLDQPMPPGLYLPNAFSRILGEDRIFFTLPPDGPDNSFDIAITDLHRIVVTNERSTRHQLGIYYENLTNKYFPPPL